MPIAPPTLEEGADAMKYFVRKTQQEYYNREMTALKEGKHLPEKSRIESLHPTLHSKGIMRVGGRLDRSELEYEMRHPEIIPTGSRLAHLLVDYTHRQTAHGGVQIMMRVI